MTQIMTILRLVALCFSVLLGCTTGPSYIKAGSTEEDLQQAIADCRAQLEVSTLNREVQQKMSQPGMVGGVGSTGGAMTESIDALDQCLKKQGWKNP